jgi:hypothetical protein
MFRGSIPGEAHVLHHCDVSACVNPSHLYLGTHQDNMSDKVKRGRQSRTGNPAMRAKTHCPSGHPYFGDNLLIYRGRRYCVTCNKVHNAERYARLVAARKAA